MKKHLGALGLGIAAVALVAGATPAAGSAVSTARHRPMRILAVTTEVQFIDLGDPGSSLGDEIVFSNKLMQDGTLVGHEGAMCTTVSMQRREAECTATFAFPDGQITAQALVTLGSQAPYDVAVTGGSGKYAGVSGQIRVQPVSSTKGIHTFHLHH